MNRKCFSCVITLLMALLLSSCSGFTAVDQPIKDSSVQQDVVEITGQPTWAANPIETRIELGKTLFYGKVVEKSEETFEHITSPELEYGWLYHTVTFEVLKCWYSPVDGVQEGDRVVYREFGGENDRYRFTMSGACKLNVGDYYVVLTSVDAFLNPYCCLFVDDGQVLIPPELQVQVQTEEGTKTVTQLSLEEFSHIVESTVMKHIE